MKRIMLTMVLSLLTATLARAASPPAPSLSHTSHELVVLLAQGRNVPAPEVVIEQVRHKSLPISLGLGSPESARWLIPERDRIPSPDLDPDSPSGLLQRYIVLSYPLLVDKTALKTSMARNHNILYVGENRPLRLSALPQDPLFPPPAGNSTPDQYQWGSYALHLPDAWDYNKGHSYVGVVDGGLAVQHPDLRAFHKDTNGNWWFDHGAYRPQFAFDYGYPDEGPNCPGDPNSSPSCVDEGQPEFVGSTVTCPQGICPVSQGGHGTHVSGIVAATPNLIDVAGACWSCSLIFSKVTYLVFNAGTWGNTGGTPDTAVAGLNGAIEKGAQVINLSFGYSIDCQATPLDPFCQAVRIAEDRDVAIVAAAGNNQSSQPDFPASDSRAIGVAGIDSTGNLWNDCSVVTNECGSNFSPTMVAAPAKQILSTFYPGIPYSDSTCPGNAEVGLCTGTSMASPYIAGSVGILRSVNPLLTKGNIKTLLTTYVENPPTWLATHGTGKPNIGAAVQAALGTAAGAVIPNRLTPLFSLYSSVSEDSFYTTVPQMAVAAMFGTSHYASVGPNVPGYSQFPAVCYVSPCNLTAPAASVYIFTGDRAPYSGAPPLVPLYRMSFTGTNPNNNANHRDTTYTTEDGGVLAFKAVGYELDGIEGYIYPLCTPEPSCIPAGAVRLYRLYHPLRDDYAIFPETELPQMQAAGYVSTPGLNDWIGYVYPNVDSDGDHLIDGFEQLIGTNPQLRDSDCDGVEDGAEVLGFPASDPLSSPVCSNHPPVAVPDTASTEHDTPITIPVLANDTDQDGDTLTVTGVIQPTNGSGTAAIGSGGTITFTPTAGFSTGPIDSVFQYTIKDSHDAPAVQPGSVTVHVRGLNHPPTPQPNSFSTPRNAPLDFTYAQLLANDTDPDGDPLTVTSVTGVPCSGGVCHYVPPAGFTGNAGPFNYTVTDNRPNGTAVSTITITVFNRAPVAVNDIANTPPNTPVTINVRANDSDPDGDPITVNAITSQPAAGTGTCAVASGGTGVVYTPPVGFMAQTSCSYTVTDGLANSVPPATITIYVNRPPIARGDQLRIPYGLQTQIAHATLLANDFDPDGDVLTISSFNTTGLNGTLSCPTGSTTCTFTPGSGFIGVTQFTYTASDGKSGFSTATVKLKVGVVQSVPVANDDLLTTSLNTSKAFTILDVLANDTDADGDVLTASIGSGPRDYGSVSCNTFNCTYTPNTGFVGMDRFFYTASDGADGSATAAINMMVLPPTTPTFDAREDQISTPQNTSRFFTRGLLTNNDYSPTGDALTITSFDTTGLNGTLDCTSDAFGCIYYPPSYFLGTTRFKYTVSDTHGHSDTAIVKVNVGVTNTAPVAANDSLTTRANTPLTFSVFELLKNDVDAQNDPMTVTVYPYPSHGTLSCSTPNYWCTYTPAAGYTGTDSFTYFVSDGIASSNQATVTVTVQPILATDAVIVSQSVPASMAMGQSYPVSLTIKNIGTVTWSPIGPQCNAFRLGSANPNDNTIWGPSRVELPATVAPGGQVTLNFNVTAPAAPGPYNFQRRMVQECVQWFGDLSPNALVSVHP